MSKFYSKTILIGRLGSDPVKNGDDVMFPILNSSVENGKEKLKSHKVYASGRQADLILLHLKRGDLCCVEGRVSSLEKDTVVRCERITFLSNRREKNA